jgi:hypothetical protein
MCAELTCEAYKQEHNYNDQVCSYWLIINGRGDEELVPKGNPSTLSQAAVTD